MNRLNRTLLAAAVAAVFTGGAFAQTRVDNSGANDANRRVGSGGRNDSTPRATPWEISNRVVYGDITGGKAFRGPTASTDPNAFRGPTGAQQFDNFIRGSSSVTTGGVTSYNANTTRAYYGDNRLVNPPAGTVTVGATGAYTTPQPLGWTPIDPRVQSVSNNGNDTVTTYSPVNSLFTTAGGPVDTIYAPNAAMSSRNGLAGLNSGQISDYTTLNSVTTSQLTPGQIRQLQSDQPTPQVPGQTPLNGTGVISPDAQTQQVPGTGTPAALLPTGQPNPGQSGSLSTSGGPIDNRVGAQGTPEMGTVTRVVPTNAQQTAESNAAGTPDAAANTGPKVAGQAAIDASAKFNADMKARKAGDTAKADNGKTDNTKPDNGKPDNNAAADNSTPPPKVSTFTGTSDKNLSDLMTKAEGQVKDGKWTSAIETYNAAEALSPRNATVKLGRANAQLGGQYYVRAEASLRQAFMADSKLLKSQYDLRSFLGDKTLQTVQKDLSDLVQNNQKDTGAAMALAYVYYNTGNERRAQALLDLADKRSAGRDPLVKAMKSTWTFKGTEESK